MRIALDAMGSDRHPAVEVQGALAALRELPGDVELLLIGDGSRIEEELAKHGDVPDRLQIHHAPDRVDASDAPATAVRRKPDSSIVRGLTLHRDGEVDAFISAGSTGAVMAASLLILRPLAGVDRPTVATTLPTTRKPMLMVDGGANVDCKPQHLLQFARLGAVYARDVMGRGNPRVGLLNIGEEPGKGNELSVETHRLLRESDLNFVGNVEGRDIIAAPCDVLVTDGFAGNVLLKFYESVAGFLIKLLKREFDSSSGRSRVARERVMRVLDYTEYGGAPLLGVNGNSIICHGGSPPRAIASAIRVARQAVETGTLRHAEHAMSDAARAASASDLEDE